MLCSLNLFKILHFPSIYTSRHATDLVNPRYGPRSNHSGSGALVELGHDVGPSKLQALTGRTAYGHSGLQLTRLQHHQAPSDDDDLLMISA